MASPCNVPDEFVQGFIKSGQSLWQAMAPNPAAQFPFFALSLHPLRPQHRAVPDCWRNCS